MSILAGNGTLLANVCGVEAPVISIIGAVETCKRVVKIRWME